MESIFQEAGRRDMVITKMRSFLKGLTKDCLLEICDPGDTITINILVNVSKSPTPGLPIPARSRIKMAEYLLRQIGYPITMRDLRDALHANGVPPPDNPKFEHPTLASNMLKNPLFVRTTDGHQTLWGLAEWQNGRAK
jgi:hypothetical protein